MRIALKSVGIRHKYWNNNAIQISYLNHSLGYLYFDEVVGGRLDGETFISDGRLVKFNYVEDPGNGCFQLDTITSNNHTWSYSYGSALADPDPEYKFCRYNLTEVSLPSNQRWQYEYYPESHPAAGKFSLS